MTNVWAVLYPILIYYVISRCIFFVLGLLMGEAQEVYMIKQMICSGATIPFLYTLWKQELYAEEVVYGKKEKQPVIKVLAQIILIGAGMACLGIALNNVIVMSPLVDVSSGFKEANEAFFAGGIWVEIAASCVVVPIAEELLFRGVVLRRIRSFAGMAYGVIFSSILFGIVHVNLVQFVYAALLGMLLGIIVMKTKRVFYAVIGHGAANLVAILRAETGVLDFSYAYNWQACFFTVAMALCGMYLFYFGMRLFSQEK